jgi:hypothetical protein
LPVFQIGKIVKSAPRPIAFKTLIDKGKDRFKVDLKDLAETFIMARKTISELLMFKEVIIMSKITTPCKLLSKISLRDVRIKLGVRGSRHEINRPG